MKLSAPIYQLKRRARTLARNENIPLHAALDRIARDEGYAGWSLLAARFAASSTANGLLPRLLDGDLLLLAARPGQGKTLQGLRLLLDAIRDGRRAVFFTLEYTEQDARRLAQSLDDARPGSADALEIITSDDICAAYIMHCLADADRGTIAVIDYLQILDQRRDKPELSRQISALRGFAQASGVILVFISQIDRSYDPAVKPFPELRDIRLPNKLDMRLFSQACFLQEGKAQFQSLA